MKNAPLIIALISISLLAGCSWFTPPLEQPVIEEKLNSTFLNNADVGTLSLTPERRVVLVHFGNGRFCAEAPTEVGLDMSRLLKIAAEASKGDELKAGLEAISATASSNAVLNKRTQGMQLFLANAYFICQMYMNKAIDKKQLMELQIRTLDAIAPLIEYEIQLIYTSQTNNNGNGDRYKPLDFDKLLPELQPEEPLSEPDSE